MVDCKQMNFYEFLIRNLPLQGRLLLTLEFLTVSAVVVLYFLVTGNTPLTEIRFFVLLNSESKTKTGLSTISLF